MKKKKLFESLPRILRIDVEEQFWAGRWAQIDVTHTFQLLGHQAQFAAPKSRGGRPVFRRSGRGRARRRRGVGRRRPGCRRARATPAETAAAYSASGTSGTVGTSARTSRIASGRAASLLLQADP